MGGSNEVIEIACGYCGCNFSRLKRKILIGRPSFCSLTCYALSRRNHTICKCVICGKEVERTAWKIKHYKTAQWLCSSECRRAWEATKSTTITCHECGKNFSRYKHHANRQQQHFCSKSCRDTWKARKNSGENHHHWNRGLTTTCTRCGTVFRQSSMDKIERNKHNFCSIECNRLWIVETGAYVGEHNANWKPKILKACDTCGILIERRPNRVGITKRTHHFCSKKCKYEWLGKQNSQRNGSKHYRWMGGSLKYYGPGWKRQAELARQRDGYKCRHCGVSQKKLGRKLDVHHIVPFRNFGYSCGQNENNLQANHLDNLITLCPRCHMQAEHGRIPVQPTLLSLITSPLSPNPN